MKTLKLGKYEAILCTYAEDNPYFGHNVVVVIVNSVMNTYRCEYIYPEEQPQIMRVSADFGVLVHRWLMREVNNMLENENKK